MKPAIIDAIRTELKRQAKDNPELTVALNALDKPDTVRVIGRIDLYELAKAISE